MKRGCLVDSGQRFSIVVPLIRVPARVAAPIPTQTQTANQPASRSSVAQAEGAAAAAAENDMNFIHSSARSFR